MAGQWHFAKNGQRGGPVAPEKLQEMISAGQLAANDLVWSEGLANWIPAAQFMAQQQPAAAAPTPSRYAAQGDAGAAPGSDAGQVSYYNPTGGLGGRTAMILAGYASATGPRDEWPLDDRQLSQLAEAEKHRKAIRGCVSLFWVLFALQLIFLIFGFIGMASLEASGPRRGPGPFRSEEGIVVLGMVVAMVGIAVLLAFSAIATKRSRIWAPITWLVLFSIAAVFYIIGFLTAINSAPMRRPEALIIPMLVSLFFLGLFIYVCGKAISAIPKFLRSPVWCQEALVNSKL